MPSAEKLTKRIIGIVLLRNEDLFIERVLLNILDFCDKIIIADHQSTDRTVAIVERLARQEKKIQLHHIHSPAQSHELVQPYAGDNVWVFGVDGDEVYDSAGLAFFKKRLIAGEFDHQWMVFGNAFHCTRLDRENKTASGFMSPPCRSVVKLYNFSLIDRWGGDCSERLHGGEISFKAGYGQEMFLNLYKKLSWQEAELRCLHLCFIRRSSIEKITDREVIRENISDKVFASRFSRFLSIVRGLLGFSTKSQWKLDKYRRGPEVQEDVSCFFPLNSE